VVLVLQQQLQQQQQAQTTVTMARRQRVARWRTARQTAAMMQAGSQPRRSTGVTQLWTTPCLGWSTRQSSHI
jgi:hypothetical protein